MTGFWNDRRVDWLKDLWAFGFSASTCASLLGTTRNAVVGKVHRLGLLPADRKADLCRAKSRAWVRRRSRAVIQFVDILSDQPPERLAAG